MGRRHWSPCRVCGGDHKNPLSSDICAPCGAAARSSRIESEDAAREEYESSPFGQFMCMAEEERWRMIFDHLEAMGAP